ncbi:MAG: TetR/AcrR family transcriptional regulator [Desulfitobacterium sp.]
MHAKKIKALETKKRISESALTLFKEVGFENMSIDSIVERAGVSKGTFYVHYESKYSLIEEYVSSLDLDYEDYFSSLPLDIKPSHLLSLVPEKIADVLVHKIGYDVIKVVYLAQLTKAFKLDSQLNYNRKLYQIFREIIRQGIEQGEFNETIDVDEAANHCVMSIRGMTYEWCIRFPVFDLKEEIVKHFNLLLSGIKK